MVQQLGVWEYKDIQKFFRVVSGSRGSTWESGQESEPGAEHLEKFESLYNEEAMSLHDSGFLLGKGKGKSLGKGSPGKSKPNKPRLLAPNLGKGQEQALQKEADHSTGPPCCLEKGRGPAAGQLEEGVLAPQLLHKAARGSSLGKAAREEKKELSHLEARAPSVASSKKSRK